MLPPILFLLLTLLSPLFCPTASGVGINSQVPQAPPAPPGRLWGRGPLGMLLCDVCQDSVAYLGNQLNSSQTLATLQRLLNATVCPLFFSKGGHKQCQLFVQGYLPQILERIAQENTPEAVCQNLTVCPSSNYRETPKVSNRRDVQSLRPISTKKEISSPQMPEGPMCSACELGVAWIETKLESNSTEEEIEQLVNSTVCEFTPVPDKAKCYLFVQVFIPKIIAMVVSEMTPEVICSNLQFCGSPLSKNRTSTIRRPLKSSSGG